MGTFLRERKEFITIDDLEIYKRAKVQWYGKGTILRDKVTGSEIKTKKQQVLRAGEFVVAEIDAKDGSFGVIPAELDGAIVSSHYFVYEIDEGLCFPLYLEWYVRTNNLQSLVKAQGSTNYSAIRSYTIYDYEIPLPPLNEQRRIVERVEALEARITKAQSLREEASLETDLIVGATSRRFFEIRNNKYKIEQLENISTRITKGESPKWQGFTYQDEGPLFVRSENVLWGKLDLSFPTHIPIEFHRKLSRSKLFEGDVLVNLVGASIGRSCVVPNNIGEANINQAVGVISPNKEMLDSDYLMHFLISRPAQEIIHGGKVDTARPNISLGDLRKLPVPLPPLDEQRRIVAYLDSVQARLASLRELQSATGEELSALLPSVLDRAFKGEL
jgi:type I restriction enzyme S subunit